MVDGPTGASGGGQREPQSVGQLLSLLLKQLLKMLPLQLVMGGAIFLGVWALHTFLLVGPNEGFNAMGGTFGYWLLSQVLALQGRMASGSAFWFALSALGGAVVTGVLRRKGAFFTDLGAVPGRIGRGIAGGNAALATMLAGAGAGVLVMAMLSNRLVAFVAVGLALLALGEGTSGFAALVLRCVYNDGRKALSKPARRLAQERSDGFIAGVMFGALAYLVMFLLPDLVFIALGVIGIVVGVVLLGQGGPAAIGTASGMLLAFFVLIGVRLAFGDDGGYAEAGGTFIDWIQSEGAGLAVAMGLPPAIGAVLGEIIGLLGPSLGAQFAAGVVPTLLTPPHGPGLGAHGGGGPGECVGGLPNYWIDTSSLRLGIADRVAGWRGVGPEITLGLTWAQDAPAGAFGRGWTFGPDGSVREQDGLLVATANGVSAAFEVAPAQPGQPTLARPVAGGGSRMTGFDRVWMWEDPESGLTRRFDAALDGSFVLTSVTDANGLAMVVERDGAGRMVALADAAGRRTTFEPDALGRCARMTLPDGRTAAFAYGPAGELTRVTDCAGVATEYTYDAAGLVSSMAVGRDRKTTLFAWAPGPDGPVVSALTDAAGGVTRYDVAPGEPRVTRVTDPEGRTVTYRSRGGRIEEVVDAAGASTRFEHDPEGRVVRIVSALGAESIAYDGGGRVASRTDVAGRTTRFEYDANGDLITRVAPDGGVWRYTYDAKRNPTGRTSPAGRRSSTVWDDRGLIVSNTDEHGGTWRYEHDALGNLISATTPAGATSRIEYDAAGLRAVRAIDPTGAVTAVEYDENDRVLRTVYPDGSETRALYDCCTAIGLTDESGSTSGIDRDAMMRPVAYAGKAGVTKLTYDRSGLVVAAGLDDTTLARFEYDAAGRQVRTTYADGSSQESSYDTAGRLARVRSPRGYTVELQRDAASNVVRVADSLGSVTECGFDVSDRLLWSRNARGHVMQVTYDADGLPVAKSANGAPVASFGYTAGGVLESVTGDGGARYTLDSCGRIVRTAWSDGTEASFELDSRGNVASMGLPGAEIVYGYDARGRITSVEFSGERVDWRYTGAGDLLAEERSNGVTSEYGWSGHEMTRARHAKGETAVYDVKWTLDRRGRATAAEGVFAAGPAPVQRERLTHDGSGRVTAVGANACSYDADGNVTARAGAYETEHDPENRAVLVSVGGAIVRYSYDAFGHRARREDQAGATLYHRDGAGRVLFETDAAGAVTAYHVWRGPVLVASVVDGKSRFYHGDRVMNVVAVTDARGKVVAAYDYDPFGTVSASSGSEKEQPFRFAGIAGATAEPAGLYLMGFRLYDPAMGQFLEKDPAGSRGTIEPYDYCAGDPVNRFDPKGLEGYTTSTYSNNSYGGGWRPGNSVEGTRPNQYTPPYYEPPKGPPPYTPAPGSDKIFAGVGNGILGTVGTIKYGTVLWGAWNAGTLLTPWGWGWRAALLLGSLGRLYYSYKYVKEGSNGESFPAGTDPVIQTVDPSGIRTWPGKAWDSICSIPSGLRNAADRLGQSIDQINRPWAYNPEFGMDDE